MREPKIKWVKALRLLTGNEGDTVRWNEEVGRWEFVLMSADGVPRSQFWGQFYNPFTGEPIEPDPATGLVPFRDLDDESMTEALANLEKTFVGNTFDGAGSTKKEVLRRMKWNRAEGVRRWKQGGEDFATMAAERGHRIRGALLTGYGGTVDSRARRMIPDTREVA